MAEQRLRYTVVRYVPNLIRDEAVNVGVIVQDVESSEVKYRFLPRSSAIRRLWHDADEKIVGLLDKQLQLAAARSTEFGRSGKLKEPRFLDRLTHEFTVSLQLTPPRGRLSPSLSVGVDFLFHTYVAEPGEFRPISYQYLAPARLQKRTWTAFEKKRLIRAGAFLRKQTLPGKHSAWTFDLALKQNNHAHVVSSLALNVPSPEAKAGRAFVLRGMIEDVRDSLEVDASAIVEPPKSDEESSGYGTAESILIDAGIKVVRIEDINDFVADLDRDISGIFSKLL